MKHNTLVLGRTGHIPDEWVELGTIIVGPDGEPHRVEHIGPPGAKSKPGCFGVAYCVKGDDWAMELYAGGRTKVYLTKDQLDAHARSANTRRDDKGFVRPR